MSCQMLPLALIALVNIAFASFYYPDPRTSVLEHLLVDTDAAYRSGFKDAITPCSNYVSAGGDQTTGRTTAAQWMRVAFHDFVTAHTDEGTGGVDASISFETLREENSGNAFNDSFGYWRTFQNAKTSMADLVALGTVTSVQNCGGPQIPYRTGRVDANGPGASGVPAPDTNLSQTLQFFANSGFNQTDSIALTACGHTMGSVHHGGFPTVVNASYVTPNNTQGGARLDTTFDQFDLNVVTEYVGQTGNLGGPLVSSFNESSRSDLRLYQSDDNQRMKELSQSTEVFFSTCQSLLGRMIDTVPRGVQLSEPLTPLTLKPVNVSFDIGQDGEMTLSGSIRYLTSSQADAPRSISIEAQADSSSYQADAPADPDTGYSVFGRTTFYPFTMPISSNSDLPSTFTVVMETGKTFYALENRLFYVPSLSSATPSLSSPGLADLNITSAVRRDLNVTDLVAEVTFLLPQPGSYSLTYGVNTTTIPLSWTASSSHGYDVYSGMLQRVNQTLLQQGSVDIVATSSSGVKIVDEFSRFGGLY